MQVFLQLFSSFEMKSSILKVWKNQEVMYKATLNPNLT